MIHRALAKGAPPLISNYELLLCAASEGTGSRGRRPLLPPRLNRPHILEQNLLQQLRPAHHFHGQFGGLREIITMVSCRSTTQVLRPVRFQLLLLVVVRIGYGRFRGVLAA